MKQLLLVGAGHAHLYILKQLQQTPLPDVKVTLLTFDDDQYYSGMFSGYAEGLYGLDDIRVNVKTLADQAEVSWMKGAAVSIDPERKTVLTDEGKQLSYDAVSFDIGSLTAGTDLPGVLEYGETIKPNAKFPAVIDNIRECERPVIVGGGAAGTELALSLQTWRNENGRGPLILVSDGGLLENEVRKAGKKAEELARRKGVVLHLHDGVEAVTEHQLVTSANRNIPYDGLLWLTGPRPQHLFASSLPVDEQGYLLVEETLQVKRYPSVFGAGDCVSVSGYEHIAKAGVYPVRQAPVLWENLRGFFGSGEGHLYRPQPSFLSILSTGNRYGLLLYKGNVFYGKWAWRLKNYIDRKFVKQYQ